MAHPKADPAALAARWLGPTEDDVLLVVDPPDPMAARTLDPRCRPEVRWFCTHWPTHRALEEEGRASSFGPWWPGSRDPASDGAAKRSPTAALLFLPRSRDRTRMMLAMLASLLPPGAPLRVVGSKGEGIESAGSQLEEVAVPEGVQVGKHARLLMGRTLPAQGGTPAVGGGAPTSLEAFLSVWPLATPSGALRIASLPGVFSHGRLDDGTRLLLDTVPDLPGPFLDVGCGAGVLGAWYASRGSGPPTLVDADAMAVESARRTLALNGIEGQVEAGDVFPGASGTPFASIVSNPPFHQGSATDDRVTATLVAGAPSRLARGGTLTLVCNRFLPVPDRLDRTFGGHRILADDGRYRVYQAVRP